MNDRYLSCFVMSYLCQQNKIKMSISRGTLLSLLKPRNAYLREFSLHAKTKTGLAFRMMTQAYVTSGSNLITKFQSQRKEKRGADTGHTLLHYFKDFSFSCLLTLPIVIGCFLLSLKFLSQQRTKQGSTKTNNYKQVLLLLLINN